VRINIRGDRDALHLRAVLRVVDDLLGGYHASLHDGLVVVDIVDEKIQCLYALLQAFLQLSPFGRRNNAGDDVERDQTLSTCVAAVDSKGNADAAKVQVGLDPLPGQGVGRLCGQPAVEFGVMRPDPCSALLMHFIEKAGHCRATLSMEIFLSSIRSIKKYASGKVSGIQGLRSQSTSAFSLSVGGSVSSETMIIAANAAGTPKMPAEAGAMWNHCWLLLPPNAGLVCTK